MRSQTEAGERVVPEAKSPGEASLLQPLLAWLRKTRRINGGTQIATELAWFGRRIDLATLTSSYRASAYELKLGAVGRALEQASYNRVAFDRSYVVTGSVPRPDNIALATEHGIGLILIRGSEVRLILDSPVRAPSRQLRARLLKCLRVAASDDCV